MSLTRARLAEVAESYGFEVVRYEPGPGARADVTLKDQRTERDVAIGIWPCSTEADLLYMLTRAAFETRVMEDGGSEPQPHAWLM